MLVKDLMAIGAVTIRSDASIAEAARLMRSQDVGLLVLSDMGKVDGVLTDRDIVVDCVGRDHPPEQCRVSRHATRRVHTADASEDALTAVHTMRLNRVRRLPVVEDDSVVGVISLSDVAHGMDQMVRDLLLGLSTPRHVTSAVRAGRVVHYYSHLGVAAVQLDHPLRKGDRIYVVGRTTDLEQDLDSIEIRHQKVETAMPGDDAAIKVNSRVRTGDLLYVVSAHAMDEQMPSRQSRVA